MNAETILAAAEAAAKHYGCNTADRNAFWVGLLEGQIRLLCSETETLRSAAGIADAIAKLPSTHEGLKAVLNAVRERMYAEDDVIGSNGFYTVAGHLENACHALTECTWADADELARIERQVRAEQDSIEYSDRKEAERVEREGRYGGQA